MDAESDLAMLFAQFESNSGGTLSPQFSADLALDIVLNQIAEQACLATGATGAAVVLWRGSEFVCRASSGVSAPALGQQMDARSGLSGLSIRTGQVQRCDDAQSDLRADPEASRRLGVRSVMVAPLVRPSGVLGILEVMSGRPAAFAERDQRTLEVLASRALRNVERAADPFLLRAEASVPTRSVSPREHPPAPAFDERSFHESSLRAPSFDESGVHESSFNEPTFAAPFSGPIFGRPASVAPARPRVDLLTWLLGLIVLAGVVLLGVLTSRRLGWNLPTWSAQAAKISSPGASQRPDPGAQSAPAPADPVTASTAPEASSASASAATEPTLAGDPASNVPAPPPAGVPGGGLRVFENGKEVFRLPATQPRPASRPMGESQSRIIELTPAAAEAILIHRVEPEYPEQARARQLQGKVVLKIRVRPDGTVEDLQLVSGPPLLAQAAIDAVQRWTFKPQLESGDPVEMRTQVTLNFRLP